jgi:hypothetical protein
MSSTGWRTGKVTVVGAGCYGSMKARRPAEYDIFATVVLTAIVEGTGGACPESMEHHS